MATVNEVLETATHKGVARAKWSPLAGSDVGRAILLSLHPDKCVEILGTFDSGTVVLQGTNDTNADGTVNLSSMKTLTAGGSNISATSAGIYQVDQNPRWIRPSVSGGGGNCAVSVIVEAVRAGHQA